MWQYWPRPIDAVSPSPLTPKTTRSRLASLAPVARGGIRPSAPLKPWACSTKYAIAFDEQPIPQNLPVNSVFHGGIDTPPAQVLQAQVDVAVDFGAGAPHAQVGVLAGVI